LATENVTPVWKSQIKQEYNTGSVSPRGGSLARTSLAPNESVYRADGVLAKKAPA